ncbi:hypothetical protein BC2230_130119 [Burkholderia cepacia]
MKIADLCPKHGISEATFYSWHSRYGGMDESGARSHFANYSHRSSRGHAH